LQTIDGGAQLTVTDDGVPFDLSNSPVRTPPETLDNAPIGGLGIQLILRLSSDVRYERRGELNILTIEFNEHAAPGSV
jgi:serine/threonine-protein kinase RsbW